MAQFTTVDEQKLITRIVAGPTVLNDFKVGDVFIAVNPNTLEQEQFTLVELTDESFALRWFGTDRLERHPIEEFGIVKAIGIKV